MIAPIVEIRNGHGMRGDFLLTGFHGNHFKQKELEVKPAVSKRESNTQHKFDGKNAVKKQLRTSKGEATKKQIDSSKISPNGEIHALLTIKEGCIAIHGSYDETSRKRIVRWLSTGRINGIRDGKRWFIPRSEINRIASGKF